MNSRWRVPIQAVVFCALLVLTLVVFRLPIEASLQLMAQGAFGDKFAWARTFVKYCPLQLTALGMIVAWKAGMYNIGGEGQFVVGGILGCAFAKFLPIGGPAETIGILIACILGGSAWAYLAGWLYIKRGVEVVISTILLNFVALQILSYVVSGPLQESKHYGV